MNSAHYIYLHRNYNSHHNCAGVLHSGGKLKTWKNIRHLNCACYDIKRKFMLLNKCV